MVDETGPDMFAACQGRSQILGDRDDGSAATQAALSVTFKQQEAAAVLQGPTCTFRGPQFRVAATQTTPIVPVKRGGGLCAMKQQRSRLEGFSTVKSPSRRRKRWNSCCSTTGWITAPKPKPKIDLATTPTRAEFSSKTSFACPSWSTWEELEESVAAVTTRSMAQAQQQSQEQSAIPLPDADVHWQEKAANLEQELASVQRELQATKIAASSATQKFADARAALAAEQARAEAEAKMALTMAAAQATEAAQNTKLLKADLADTMADLASLKVDLAATMAGTAQLRCSYEHASMEAEDVRFRYATQQISMQQQVEETKVMIAKLANHEAAAAMKEAIIKRLYMMQLQQG